MGEIVSLADRRARATADYRDAATIPADARIVIVPCPALGRSVWLVWGNDNSRLPLGSSHDAYQALDLAISEAEKRGNLVIVCHDREITG